MAGFCWPGGNGLMEQLMRLLTGPGTHEPCPWWPQPLGEEPPAPASTPLLPVALEMATQGALPRGIYSGIPPVFLASDGFGYPDLYCVSFSSLLNNHRKGNDVLPVSPCFTCILFSTSSHQPQGTNESSTVDCWLWKCHKSLAQGTAAVGIRLPSVVLASPHCGAALKGLGSPAGSRASVQGIYSSWGFTRWGQIQPRVLGSSFSIWRKVLARSSGGYSGVLKVSPASPRWHPRSWLCRSPPSGPHMWY